jgi:thioredoxin 1
MKEVSPLRTVSILAVCTLITSFGGLLGPGDAAEPKIDLQALLAKRIPVLIEFGSNCCPSCANSKVALDFLAKAYAGRAVVMGVDAAVQKDLIKDFRVIMTPTQVFLTPEGKEFIRTSGPLKHQQAIEVFSKMGLAPPAVTSPAAGTTPRSGPSTSVSGKPPTW